MKQPIQILAKNLMILASAGSGKTYQLGNRVIGLVGARGVDPERIVALTFTRKAAGEFADEVLRKLAECASDPREADAVAAQIGAGPVDFPAVLERVTRALPRFQLGTIDSFFARIVRCFPHELGLAGGNFELIEGPRLEAAVDDILQAVLGDAADDGAAEEFLHAFRRATAGKEGQRVAETLREFLATWHGRWKAGLTPAAWGANAFGDLPAVQDWEANKLGLTAELREAVEATAWTDKRQPDKMAELLDAFEAHTVGSGHLADAGTVFDALVASAAAGDKPLRLKAWKEFNLPQRADELLARLLRLCAGCELAAALQRTAAVRDVVARHDLECARRLRAKGLFGFDDVKSLMGEWARDEQGRLRREQVDFRLDARYDHWLLDEFQDTSVAEWTGLQTLLDEAASRDDGSLFLVGDKKQAIYAFKGGDVRLFDRVEARYGRGEDGMRIETMPESWRSCPAVLELVNRVCGDLATVERLFGGEVARRWQWEEHVSAKPDLTGEARVETVEGQREERLVRMVEILREIGVGTRAMTCGVLVRTNKELRDVAERLRENGFDVIEEGRRLPVSDNLPGVALHHLVRWLADPADTLAREVVAMSPFDAVLREAHGEAWQAQWEGLTAKALEAGFATAFEELIDRLWADWSEFNRRRAGDVIAALAEHDATGGGSAREAARRLQGLEVSQAPGVAAVQVMTIHKSKGLGFDVVVIPEIESDKVPDFGRFRVAEGAGWVVQTPAQWVRSQFPELAAAEEQWGQDQRYDAMCLLYVALTRAKRGLYVLLSPPSKSAKDTESRASLANWLATSCGADFQAGDPAWFTAVPPREMPVLPTPVGLGLGEPRRPRRTPSGAKAKAGAGAVGRSRGGMEFGNAVHKAFERVEWIDDGLACLGDDEASRLVRETLAVPEVRALFEKLPGREVFREQAIESILGGEWLSGAIDCLVVDHDASGAVTAATVVDFKTDAVAQASDLLDRYRGQMEAYRQVIATAYGLANVSCVLVSTALRTPVDVPS